MAGKPGRPGAAKGRKGGKVGTGGHGKQALEGRGPTPKAEDRPYHKAYKAKAAAEKHKQSTGATSLKRGELKRGEFLAPAARTAGSGGAAARSGRPARRPACLRQAAVSSLHSALRCLGWVLNQFEDAAWAVGRFSPSGPESWFQVHGVLNRCGVVCLETHA